MTESVFRLSKKIVDMLNAKIEARLQELMDNGVAFNKLSMTHEPLLSKTTIYVDGEPDSRFWLEWENDSITIKGTSIRKFQ
jgi:hypothetical protein